MTMPAAVTDFWTKYKKYWPYAAAGVGVLAIILFATMKKKSSFARRNPDLNWHEKRAEQLSGAGDAERMVGARMENNYAIWASKRKSSNPAHNQAKFGRRNPPEERPQSVISEIRKAYSDSSAQTTAYNQRWNKPSKWGERELKFRASKPVKAKHLYEYLKYIGGYNRFSPTRVSRMLGQIDPEAWVWVAREYSVALYVSPTSQANLEAIEKAFTGYANEIHRSGDLGLRLWWD
jgi:hypothetical protein